MNFKVTMSSGKSYVISASDREVVFRGVNNLGPIPGSSRWVSVTSLGGDADGMIDLSTSSIVSLEQDR